MDAKRMGILIAEGMPPPGKLKRAMSKDKAGAEDEPESDADGSDEADAGGGVQAVADMFSAAEKGDKAGAYDAFMDAVKICVAKAKEEPAASDKPYS